MNEIAQLVMVKLEENKIWQIVTSIFLTSSFGVGADTIIWRAVGLMKPSSTALSMKDKREL